MFRSINPHKYLEQETEGQKIFNITFQVSLDLEVRKILTDEYLRPLYVFKVTNDGRNNNGGGRIGGRRSTYLWYILSNDLLRPNTDIETY